MDKSDLFMEFSDILSFKKARFFNEFYQKTRFF